jgi:hypothetical protein
MSILPSNKKRGKQKRVVNNRLIDTSRKILRSLLPQNLIVTQVIKQTGLSDKSYFFYVKDTLIKSKLIKQTGRDKRSYILELNETGRDLAKLEKYIEDAQTGYQTLVRGIKKKFHTNEYHLITSEIALNNDERKANQIFRTLRNRLRDEGWNSDELDSYKGNVLDALIFERKTAYIFIVALCSNYVFFLAKFWNNEIARSILHKIITNAFDELISRSTEIFPNYYERNEPLEDIAGPMMSSLYGPIYDYIKEYSQIDVDKISLPPYDVDLKKSNKFLAEESIEMIRSIHYLYKLGNEELSKEASELIEKYSSDDNSSDHVHSV